MAIGISEELKTEVEAISDPSRALFIDLRPIIPESSPETCVSSSSYHQPTYTGRVHP